MASSSHLLLFLIVTLIHLTLNKADESDRFILQCESYIINDGGIITKEVNAILEELSQKPTMKQLTSISGLSWCRDDVEDITCSSCLSIAAQKIKTSCKPNISAARSLHLDFCYIRFGLENFFNQVDTTSFQGVWCTGPDNLHQANRDKYGHVVDDLMMTVREKVVQEKTMFMAMSTIFPPENMRIRGNAKCSPDLSKENCEKCLEHGMSVIRERCLYYTFCEVVYGSCFHGFLAYRRS